MYIYKFIYIYIYIYIYMNLYTYNHTIYIIRYTLLLKLSILSISKRLIYTRIVKK